MMPYQFSAVSELKWDLEFGNAVDTGQETRGEVPQRIQRVGWHASSSFIITTEMQISSDLSSC